MRALITVNVFLAIFLCSSPGYGQLNRDGGSTGTLNHDYFYPDKDAHTQWLIKDIEKYHLEPAKAHFQGGQLKDAIGDLDYLLARIVNHPEALMLLGALARLTKSPALPVPYYERALKLYPQYAVTHAQYGAYLIDVGNNKAGIAHLNKALELNPDLALAHAWLAKAYYKDGNVELARQAAAQARTFGYKGKIE